MRLVIFTRPFCATRETRAFFARVCFEGLTRAFCPKCYLYHSLIILKERFCIFHLPRMQISIRWHSTCKYHSSKSCITCKHNEKCNVKTLKRYNITRAFQHCIQRGKKFCHLLFKHSGYWLRIGNNFKPNHNIKCNEEIVKMYLRIVSLNPFSQFQ